MGKLFGTDGIRGTANVDITSELAFKVGTAGAYVLTKETHHSPKILVGMDTRISCDMIESALTSGMCSVGANVYIAGVIPTPAISFLVKKYNFDAGVVISASHNSFEDNGIKFFSNTGYKLPDTIENEIEEIIENSIDSIKRAEPEQIGKKYVFSQGLTDYTEFLETTLNGCDLKGLKIAIDCANGATFLAAPTIFKKLGAEVFVCNNIPNGININQNCGSTHMEYLKKFTLENNADIGIAFDGDGDRCLAVDEKGKTVDGDEIMTMLSIALKERGNLNNNTLVATVMSNLGLFIMGEKLDINIEKTSVGDRYVLEKMLEGGFNFGGEQSGHIIFLDYNTTGDGILTALQLMLILKQKSISLSDLNSNLTILPQVIVNAKVNSSKKNHYLENTLIKTEIERIEKMFKDSGRVLIRPSGTESIIRVMIEGSDKEILQKEASTLAKLIEDQLLN